MKTQKQSFEELRAAFPKGPYYRYENVVCTEKVCIKRGHGGSDNILNTTFRHDSDTYNNAELAFRLLNAFVAGDGLRVLRALLSTCEGAIAEYYDPSQNEFVQAARNLIAQLDGHANTD